MNEKMCVCARARVCVLWMGTAQDWDVKTRNLVAPTYVYIIYRTIDSLLRTDKLQLFKLIYP